MPVTAPIIASYVLTNFEEQSHSFGWNGSSDPVLVITGVPSSAESGGTFVDALTQGTTNAPFAFPTSQTGTSNNAYVGMDKSGNLYAFNTNTTTHRTTLYQTNSSGTVLQSALIDNGGAIAGSTFDNFTYIVYYASGNPKIAILAGNNSTGFYMVMVDVNTFTVSYVPFGEGSGVSPARWNPIVEETNCICADTIGNIYLLGSDGTSSGTKMDIVQFTPSGAIGFDNSIPYYTSGVYPQGILGTQQNNLLVFNHDSSVSLIKSSDYTSIFTTVQGLGWFAEDGNLVPDMQFNWGLTAHDDTFPQLANDDQTSTATVNINSATSLTTLGSFLLTRLSGGVVNVLYMPLSTPVVVVSDFNNDVVSYSLQLSSKVAFPLTGYQYPSGAPVANGYLTIRLSQDGTSSSEQISSQWTKVPLDVNGQIVGSPQFYPNNLISPSGTYYVLICYNSGGELVLGPKVVTIS